MTSEKVIVWIAKFEGRIGRPDELVVRSYQGTRNGQQIRVPKANGHGYAIIKPDEANYTEAAAVEKVVGYSRDGVDRALAALTAAEYRRDTILAHQAKREQEGWA